MKTFQEQPMSWRNKGLQDSCLVYLGFSQKLSEFSSHGPVKLYLWTWLPHLKNQIHSGMNNKKAVSGIGTGDK